MASEYGLNFGFRRSDESVRVSEGRFRTPATGAALLIGTAVKIDTANAGFLAPCAANDPLVPGVAGLLVQEEIMFGSIYGAPVSDLDSFSYGIAKPNRLSVVTTGAGTKVWFRNTTAQSRVDGRAVAGVTMWDATTGTPALGDTLGWNGTQFVKTATAAAAWMTITSINTARGYVEGVLLK